jgi:transposase-like protein
MIQHAIDLTPFNGSTLSERISTGLTARKGFSEMKQNRHTVDQIIAKLRRADVELGKGKKVPEICRLLEVSEQTYYRWRQKYGGMQPEMVKQLKRLQKENSRLKKLVAEQALDMEILKEASRENW